MRNQIAIARRNERIFAIRFFVRFSFIGRFAGEEDVRDFFAELIFSEIALEEAILTD